MDQLMQAIRVHRYGGPDQLVLEQVARPEPGPNDVLVRVHAAGVLPIEWKVRQGLFKAFRPVTFPYIPGSAFAGVIAAAGRDVTGYQVGDAVFGRSSAGTYAEYTVLSTRPEPGVLDLLGHKAEALSFEAAATISGGATTAWTALLDDGSLEPGQHVLVHGGAGCVGSYAVQFARVNGAQVTATASAANLDYVRALGAQIVIDYAATAFESVVKDVDLVLDTIGGAVLERSFAVVRPGGTIVSLLQQPSTERAAELGIRAINKCCASSQRASPRNRTPDRLRRCARRRRHGLSPCPGCPGTFTQRGRTRTGTRRAPALIRLTATA